MEMLRTAFATLLVTFGGLFLAMDQSKETSEEKVEKEPHCLIDTTEDGSRVDGVPAMRSFLIRMKLQEQKAQTNNEDTSSSRECGYTRTLADTRGKTLADTRGRTLADTLGQTLADTLGQTLADKRYRSRR